jgi:CelD/BcsL family acetyltransferase involved in cellulose biosynthesis
MSDAHWKFEWITDWDTIYSDSFQQFWLDFIENAHEPHVFFHPALCMAWLDTYRPIRKLYPWFCIARNGETTVFFPMVLWRRNWKNAFQRLLVPVGYSDYDYHDPLVIKGDETTENSFFRALKPEMLLRVGFDSLLIDGLHRGHTTGFEQDGNEIDCPYIDLTSYSSFNEYYSSLPSSLRKTLRKRTRNLELLGNITIQLFEQNKIDAALLEIQKMREHHRKRWPNSYQTDDFLINIVTRSIANGILHFSTLNLEGDSISWRINFQFKNTLYGYMPSVNYEFDKYSVGKQHLVKIIEYAFSQPILKYDELRGLEDYKLEFCSQSGTVTNVQLTRPNMTSRLKDQMVELKGRLIK